MARIVKAEEYAAKRNEILAVAQRLVYSKGYEQMSIQDVLDELQISKGAFYHYFDSKQALLEALIEHMLDEAEQIIHSIAQDPRLPALRRLQDIMVTLNRWRAAQKTFLVALLRVWYSDDNAIVRQKVRVAIFKRITPLLTSIIHLGVQEGSLTMAYPDQAGEVALSLLQDLSDAVARLLLSSELESDDLPRIELTVAAYLDGLERVLGVASGSLHLIDAQMLKEWLEAAREKA